jgi:hypothetical protein
MPGGQKRLEQWRQTGADFRSGAWHRMVRLGSIDQHGKGVFLAASGVMIVVLKVRSGLYMRELLTTGTRADGVVVGAEASSDGDGGTRYYPRVRFTTRDGQTTEFTSGLGYASEPAVGDPRPVRYRADDPEQAEIDKPAPFIIFGALSLLLGLALVVAGAFMYVQGSVPFMDFE